MHLLWEVLRGLDKGLLGRRVGLGRTCYTSEKLALLGTYVHVCVGMHSRTHTYTDRTQIHGAPAGTLEQLSRQATNKRRQVLRADFHSETIKLLLLVCLDYTRRKRLGGLCGIYRVYFGWFDMKYTLHSLRKI